jgi:hypothetical protein
MASLPSDRLNRGSPATILPQLEMAEIARIEDVAPGKEIAVRFRRAPHGLTGPGTRPVHQAANATPRAGNRA